MRHILMPSDITPVLHTRPVVGGNAVAVHCSSKQSFSLRWTAHKNTLLIHYVFFRRFISSFKACFPHLYHLVLRLSIYIILFSSFLRSYSSCLLLLPSLPVTSILPSNFSPIICLRRQSVRKLWQIYLVLFLLLYPFLLHSAYYFLFYTALPNYLCFVSPTSHIITLHVFLIHFPKCPNFSTIQSYDPDVPLYWFHISI
jgi:hypothetical protein